MHCGQRALTMNVALALVRLRDEQICHVAADAVLVADGISTKYFLQAVSSQRARRLQVIRRAHILALTNARSQFCLLIMEIISGAALPSSLSLPTCVAARMPKAASVVASASFFCTS